MATAAVALMTSLCVLHVMLSWTGGVATATYLLHDTACIFPDYLQIGDTGDGPQWRGHIVRNKRTADSYSLLVTFHDYLMKCAVSGNGANRPQPYTKRCVQKVTEDTFVVSQRLNGEAPDMYACMRILKRSQHVIQIKESDLHPNVDVESLCAESHTILNPWPLVNHVGLMAVSEPCPLVGGFNIRVYDSEPTNSGTCNALEGETRLESECANGEGMEFQFRHTMCVPRRLDMDVTQRLYCIASWNEEAYTFAVLRHDRHEKQWCFRYNSYNEQAYLGYLFDDFKCDTSIMPDSLPHVRIDIIPDVPRSISSLCMDEYEGCETWKNPCVEQGSQQQLMCPRRCNLCDDTQPSVCTMPSGLQGQWLEDGMQGKRVYSVDMYSLLPQNASRMQCIQWKLGKYQDQSKMEQITVTTFENGCRPRYQCLQLYKSRKSSSIVRYRLSQAQRWPFEGGNGHKVDCTLFNFRDDRGTQGDGLRSHHFKILVSMDELVYVKCKLPQTRQFSVIFNNGQDSLRKCNGTLTNDVLTSPSKLTLELHGCGRDINPLQQFACLDSSTRGLRDDLMIVTESLNESSELRCWLFPTYTAGRPQFYLLPASMCNEGSRDRIQHGTLLPLAVFTDYNQIIPDRPVVLDDAYGDSVLGGGSQGGGDGSKSSRHADEGYRLADPSTVSRGFAVFIDFTLVLGLALFLICLHQ